MSHRADTNERARDMMSQKTADSVKLETFSEHGPTVLPDGSYVFDRPYQDKDRNERDLCAKASEFFGHDEWTHTGFRHQPDNGGGLFTSAIFYDDTPYEVEKG